MKRSKTNPYACREAVIRERILGQLKEQAEEPYRIFSSRLLPPGERLLGVRLPLLRAMAGQIAEGAWREYLEACGDEFLEETMLQGMVIGALKMDWQEKEGWVAQFVPKIRNWSVCDSFCSSLHRQWGNRGERPARLESFLQPYLESEKEYEARFGLVMYLMCLTKERHIPHVWKQICAMKAEGYYAKMAAAWAISIYFREHPHAVMPYLEHPGEMDGWIYRKSLQKILESTAVDAEKKESVRLLLKKWQMGHG